MAGLVLVAQVLDLLILDLLVLVPVLVPVIVSMTPILILEPAFNLDRTHLERQQAHKLNRFRRARDQPGQLLPAQLTSLDQCL